MNDKQKKFLLNALVCLAALLAIGLVVGIAFLLFAFARRPTYAAHSSHNAKHPILVDLHSDNWFERLENNKCLKSNVRLNSFDGALGKIAYALDRPERSIGVPSRCPAGWNEHGVQFINMHPINWKKFGRGNMRFVHKNKHDAVGAIGGIIDIAARSQDRSTAYMALAGNQKTHYFDLHAFDFWCADFYAQPVSCRIGVQTSHDRQLDPKANRVSIFEFEVDPKNATQSKPAPAILPNDQRHNIRLAQFGRKLPIMQELGIMNGNFDGSVPGHLLADAVARDLNANGTTVYIDNISYSTHECGKKEPQFPHNEALRKVFEYDTCPPFGA